MLFGSIGLSAIYAVHHLNRDVELLYRHPFAVSNAVRNIHQHLVGMHNALQSMLLHRSSERVAPLAEEIAARELEVMREFDIVFDRFLGDPAQIARFREEFIDWRSTREEIIYLARSGMYDEARRLGLGPHAQQMELLAQQARDVVDFALAKANEFQSAAGQGRQVYITLLGSLLTLGMLFSILIAMQAFRRVRSNQRQLLRQAQLIDEHIGMATVSTNGDIRSVSQHLARMLGLPSRTLSGAGVDAILPLGDSAPSAQNILDYGGSDRVWSGYTPSPDPDEAKRHVSVRTYPVRDDDFHVSEYMLLYQDITEKVQIEELSRIDKLTGLPNRRAYDEKLERLLRRARRDRRPIALAILDVDNFKAFNDLYGHPQGDFALQQLGAVLLNTLRRPDDYAFRLGGEEFALLLIGLDRHQANAFLDKIRAAVQELGLPHSGNQGVAPVLTVSIGATVVGAGQQLAAQVLYQQADRQLYLAKRQRNAISVSDSNDLMVIDGRNGQPTQVTPHSAE